MTPTTELLPDTAPPPHLANLLDEPTVEECLAEWGRYYDAPPGTIDPGAKHPDEFVAFYNGKVVDYDPDPTELLNRAAAGLGVHSARLVIAYLGTYDLVLSISSPLFD